MLREPARAGLLTACLLLSTAAPAAASAPDEAPAGAASKLLGWGAALLTLSAAGWAASARLAPRWGRYRAERARVARILAALEAEQRARRVERERTGLRRRRRSTASAGDARTAPEGGITFGRPLPPRPTAPPPPPPAPPAASAAPAPSRTPAAPAPPPAPAAPSSPPRSAASTTPSAPTPAPPAPSPAPEPAAAGEPRPTSDAPESDRLTRLLAKVAETERRLGALVTDLDRVAAATVQPAPARTVEEPPGAARTLDLGAPDLPPPAPDPDDDDDAFDVTSEELLARLRALSGAKALPDRTVDLGPLELPDGPLAPDTLVLVDDDAVRRLRAFADMAIPERSFTPIVARCE